MVIIISGTPGAGKSSVSKELAKKFDNCVYISVDHLRHMVYGGYKAPWEKGANIQLELGGKNCKDLTRNFIEAGFVVIIDDVMGDDSVRAFSEEFGDVHGFLLLPSLEILKKRDLERSLEDQMGDRIDELYPQFADVNHEVLKIIDSTNQSLEETVETVFNQIQSSDISK